MAQKVVPADNPVRVYDIIDAFADFTPSLSKREMKLTAKVKGINPKLVTKMTVQAAVAGTNQISTVTFGTTPTSGVAYRVYVQWIGKDGRREIAYFDTIATSGMSADDLAAKFETLIDAKGTDVPFTASSATNVLTITSAPTNIGMLTGQVNLTIGSINKDSMANFGTVATGTPNVEPIGQYGQVVANNSDAVSGKSYSVVTIVYGEERSIPVPTDLTGVRQITDVIYVQNDITANSFDYIISTCNHYAGLVSDAEGDTVDIIPEATDATTTGVIPFGTRMAAVTSGNSAHIVDIIADHPVGHQLDLYGNATAYVLKMPAGEKLNGGTAAGTAAIAASQFVRLVKVATDNWDGHGFDIDGTIPSTTVPQSA